MTQGSTSEHDSAVSSNRFTTTPMCGQVVKLLDLHTVAKKEAALKVVKNSQSCSIKWKIPCKPDSRTHVILRRILGVVEPWFTVCLHLQ